MLAHYLFVAAIVLIFAAMLFVMVRMVWWLAAHGVPQVRKGRAAAQNFKQPLFLLRQLFPLFFVPFFLLPALSSGHAFVSLHMRALLTHSFFILLLIELVLIGCTAAVWTILSNRAVLAKMNEADESFLSVPDKPPEDNWLVPERP